jgi:hypothetical protein
MTNRSIDRGVHRPMKVHLAGARYAAATPSNAACRYLDFETG